MLAALAAAGLPSIASAQQSASPPDVLPTIVISPTSLPTPEAQIANSVTVVTAEDIEREQRRTVPDILANVPGLNVVQAGGPGSQTSVFVRGTNANHVKVLIDGIDVSDPSNPARTFEFGHLLANDIERIEVLRGPQSGLYGSDAIGGVISIVTKRGKGPAKVTGLVEGGSFGTFNQAASLSGSKENFDYAFNVIHFRAADTPVTPPNLLPPGRAAIGDFYDNTTVSTKLGLDISESFRLNYVGRYTESELRFTQDEFLPPTFAGVPRAEQSTQNLKQFFTRAEAVWTGFDGRFTNYFGVNYTDHRTENLLTPTSIPTINTGQRTKVDWRGVSLLMPGQTLVTGLEHEIESMGTAFVNADNANSGGYIELQSEFAQRLFIVSNVRHDANERFGEATTYRVAPALLLPVTETKLKASVGSGFKAPTLNQLFVDFLPTFVANPNLLPEESVGYDVGFEQPLFNNRVRFGATWFHNDITNLISGTGIVQTVPFTVRTNVNVGKAETSGVEAFIAVNPTDRLWFRADYTYTDAFDAITHERLLRRPRHKASLAAGWNPIDPLTLSATLLYVGEFIDGNRDFSIPRLVAPGFTVVNIAADYKINDYAKVFARIDNLFDERYEEPTGFLRPGFAVYGGVRLTN
ncbi:TonB-dependent receptor domain-containing protein [Bradyrhizobium sp. LHD-71]|uniref:TonB-dependent receptor plug domain-containing protein n=1 Tax=Bradyrhizobium sp. LHD-71 TaxID=3072141 RepID=UPI0028107AF8|nr:TonB-dependent receptor [Bradyrhizobium sp. LHD-71]MDQ8727727.1 TonB-dependent receptor [Bradyrhizobium sp. LHD-71]